MNATASPTTVVRRKPSLLKKLGLMLVAMLITMLALEIVLRVYYAHEWDVEAMEQRLGVLDMRPFVQAAPDGNLVFELKPNVDVTFKTARTKIGPEGFRIHPTRPAPPPEANAFRLAMIGDSTAFAAGAEYEDSYAELVRIDLEKRLGRPVELRNYSVPGYSTLQELHTFKQKVMSWKPQLLILHYDHNDAETAGFMPPNYIPPSYGDNFLNSALIKFAARRLRAISERGGGSGSGVDSGDAVTPDGFYSAGPHYDAHVKSLRQIKDLADSIGTPVVTVIFDAGTDPADLEKNAHYQTLHVQLIRSMESWGMVVVDMYPHNRKFILDQGMDAFLSFHISKEDAHPNAKGHRFIADHVSRFLLEKGLPKAEK